MKCDGKNVKRYMLRIWLDGCYGFDVPFSAVSNLLTVFGINFAYIVRTLQKSFKQEEIS